MYIYMYYKYMYLYTVHWQATYEDGPLYLIGHRFPVQKDVTCHSTDEWHKWTLDDNKMYLHQMNRNRHMGILVMITWVRTGST